MLPGLSEAEKALVLKVFRSCCRAAATATTGSFWKLCTILPFNITWRALPAEFGKWNSVWKCFWRLSRSGVFEAFFDALASLSGIADLAHTASA